MRSELNQESAMRCFAAALPVLLFAPLSTLSAQDLPTIEPGERVRVMAPDCGVGIGFGRFETWRGDTLGLTR